MDKTALYKQNGSSGVLSDAFRLIGHRLGGPPTAANKVYIDNVIP